MSSFPRCRTAAHCASLDVWNEYQAPAPEFTALSTSPHLVAELQETASNHIVALRGRSEQYYAADPELAKLDLIFVLTRMQIRMTSYPRW